MPGGSSSGSAALVAAGLVDMAIGGDQGGSIRMRSCWCGIYGIEPPYGLVPYTGIGPIELTTDHVGPLARTAEALALLPEVIAGPGGPDPRQCTAQEAGPYSQELARKIEVMRFGVVREGYAWEDVSQADVDEKVGRAVLRFTQMGANVEELSIPRHRDGFHILTAITQEGATKLMI